MKYKTPDLSKELMDVDIFLRVLAFEFQEVCEQINAKEPTITRIKEEIKGSSGVHELGRAVDFRDEIRISAKHSDFTYSEDERGMILRHFERHFGRTDQHLTLMWHSFQGMPYHFHLQISPSVTVYAPEIQAQIALLRDNKLKRFSYS